MRGSESNKHGEQSANGTECCIEHFYFDHFKVLHNTWSKVLLLGFWMTRPFQTPWQFSRHQYSPTLCHIVRWTISRSHLLT